jgi:hypothetical protein
LILSKPIPANDVNCQSGRYFFPAVIFHFRNVLYVKLIWKTDNLSVSAGAVFCQLA